MAASRSLSKDVLRKFRTVKVLTLAELMLWLSCSRRTVHRRLRSWGALSSYNSNGRYYTVEEVAQFDENGIWCWQGVCFSRFGNLFETVCGLLDASPAGLSAEELGQILGMDAYSFLSHFVAQQRLARERIGGCYVYLSPSVARRAEQQQKRLQRTAAAASDKVSNALAVEILVAIIRAPQAPPEQLAEQLQARDIAVEAADIQHVLAHHGLAKKGGPDSPPSRP